MKNNKMLKTLSISTLAFGVCAIMSLSVVLPVVSASTETQQATKTETQLTETTNLAKITLAEDETIFTTSYGLDIHVSNAPSDYSSLDDFPYFTAGDYEWAIIGVANNVTSLPKCTFVYDTTCSGVSTVGELRTLNNNWGVPTKYGNLGVAFDNMDILNNCATDPAGKIIQTEISTDSLYGDYKIGSKIRLGNNSIEFESLTKSSEIPDNCVLCICKAENIKISYPNLKTLSSKCSETYDNINSVTPQLVDKIKTVKDMAFNATTGDVVLKTTYNSTNGYSAFTKLFSLGKTSGDSYFCVEKYLTLQVYSHDQKVFLRGNESGGTYGDPSAPYVNGASYASISLASYDYTKFVCRPCFILQISYAPQGATPS